MPHENQAQATTQQRKRSHEYIWTRAINYIKSEMQERRAQRQKENPTEQSARITANATRWIAFFSFALAACAVYQFIILGRQLTVMREDERAWVVLKGVGPKPELDKPWEVWAILTNTGKSPANNLRVSCRLDPVHGETEFLPEPAYETSTLLAPKAETHCSLNPLAIPTFTQEVQNLLTRREKTIYVHGTTVYDDIFRQTHWFIFCRAMNPNGIEWGSCKEHPDDTGDGHRSPSEH
jgi:hypothetical protein